MIRETMRLNPEPTQEKFPPCFGSAMKIYYDALAIEHMVNSCKYEGGLQLQKKLLEISKELARLRKWVENQKHNQLKSAKSRDFALYNWIKHR